MTGPAANHRRRKAYSAGKRAEWIASAYLLLKGYRTVARRFKCPVGEIDLILSRGNYVVFIEVKYRAVREAAAFSISEKQQQRISRAAQFWIAKNHRVGIENLRFDVILLAPWRWPLHIENAFLDNSFN